MAKPCPRSPPRARNKLPPTEVQILDREIGLLQEELQSLEALQSVSQCCKEVHDFVGSNPDPLIPLKKRKHKSRSIWECLRHSICCEIMFKPKNCSSHYPNRGKLCFNFSWICCSCICSFRLETLCCCGRCYPKTCCCNSGQIWWCRPHCLQPSFSCPGCTCGCIWSCCPSCLEVCLCPRCTKPCCSKQCLC